MPRPARRACWHGDEGHPGQGVSGLKALLRRLAHEVKAQSELEAHGINQGKIMLIFPVLTHTV